MIVIKLQGGLGNQLFQYAMGRSLALKKRTELKLDPRSGFAGDAYERSYALRWFNIEERFATPREIARLSQPQRPNWLERIVQHYRPYYKAPVLIERGELHFNYDANVERTPKNIYVNGYWQNAEYFADIADLIRREFSLRERPSEMTGRAAAQITGANAVCIHIRHLFGFSASGAPVPQGAAVHGSLGLDYYHSAVARLAATVADPHLFVFSDDPAWARENLRLPHPTTFVDHNGSDQAHEDLHLMSLCKHFVIANSTLSWWGAWLANQPGKIVFAPRRWFAREANVAGLFPAGWIQL